MDLFIYKYNSFSAVKHYLKCNSAELFSDFKLDESLFAQTVRNSLYIV